MIKINRANYNVAVTQIESMYGIKVANRSKETTLEITGGIFDGFVGYVSTYPEADVSLTIVPFGGYYCIELVPSTAEIWLALYLGRTTQILRN